jgi:hypothetical protein
MAYFLLSSKGLAQNGVRRETVVDWFGGARRTLCACEEPYRSDLKPARTSSEKSLYGVYRQEMFNSRRSKRTT